MEGIKTKQDKHKKHLTKWMNYVLKNQDKGNIIKILNMCMEAFHCIKKI